MAQTQDQAASNEMNQPDLGEPSQSSTQPSGSVPMTLYASQPIGSVSMTVYAD